MSSSAIEVNNVWKRYGLPIPEGLRKPLNRLYGKIAMPDQWALQDVSFKVERGDALGIIGRNGAGKSTMLKVLAGVTPATRGTVRMHGTIFPMIELNAGINPELTGRENIYLLGTIMGFTTQEISDRYDVIADFTELEEWLEKPVWLYSSGMKARLGFGVAMNIDAQILLIDEVLAVGDQPFKKKCYNRLEALTNEGAAVVFVSHNNRQLERLC
ncbi:MAG: ABC transporter ATP-binding protein, partial [Anaerolineae bacterium]